MPKYSPLIAAIIGAVILVIQQAVSAGNFDLKVVGFAVLIAAVGAAGTFLKGKGASLTGIIGTVLYSFYTIWQTGTFTWNEFILSGVLAVALLFAPTAIPEPENPEV